jgi:hypothetical protein
MVLASDCARRGADTAAAVPILRAKRCWHDHIAMFGTRTERGELHSHTPAIEQPAQNFKEEERNIGTCAAFLATRCLGV